MRNISTENLLDLSVAERIQLAEDLWDSIATVPEALELTEAQKEELNKRLKAYHSDPKAGSPWDTVKKRIKKQS